MSTSDYTDESIFGCPECESDREVLVYKVQVAIDAHEVREWGEDGEPSDTRLVSEGTGRAPEEFDLELKVPELRETMKRFHCTACSLMFDEPVPLN